MVRLQDKLFGTILRIDIYGDDIRYQKDIVQMFNDIQRMHTKFTIFNDNSEMMRLNKGEEFIPCKELIQIIGFAIDYYRSSNYYFNPCGFELKKGISTELGNPNLIGLSQYKVNLNGQAMDLGAIAKGYALDYIKTYCEFNMIENIVVNFGGAIYIRGNYPNKIGYNVGIRHPKLQDENICILKQMSNCMINTSVNDDQEIIKDGVKYGHIHNQGKLIEQNQDLQSVSLIGTNGAELDAYATAMVAMGLELSLEFIKEHQEIDYVLVSKNKIYTNLKPEILEVCDQRFIVEEIIYA